MVFTLVSVSRSLRHVRSHSKDATIGATSLNILGPDNERKMVYINRYSTKGFTINGMRVFGSVALLPRAILQWKISDRKELTPEAFSLFHLVEPRIEILVLGLGDRSDRLNPDVHNFLRRKGIPVEIQSTQHACATFNFLMEEGRIAAAGLIPPTVLPD
ncbi:NADH dehydrogenase [ubiquinone] 1 alpha subcomplex assembly factor 3-like [Corticium candelabrum]|uniref:NADH dehydrogenase [ubiquinone] 1 alpha subcomplex assembly factor 3-like n=1 Tax=Corticium candelabrum TaxID=121492 RepID=UPI002E253AE8|nr:NADH dehydrogenase [ubiquinone] 1 alpha subcomplex assembly factor 3-like [Corticium candelabrum]